MPQPRNWVHPLLVATFLCGLNAVKPPVTDDPAYLYFARQIAARPADPYEFTIHWYEHPQPAMTVLAPPVFLYWLGFGVAVVGDDPTLLKLWCWPWCLAFTTGLSALLRRFAPGVERPMVWLTALSPAVLPAVNLMLDVPALALGLLAIVAMLAACERNSFDLAVLAGVLAGLAMQTKYTAVTLPPVLALTAGRDRWRLTVVSWLAAGVVFVGWEVFLVHRYGASHFVYHVTHPQDTARRANMIGPLFTLVGGVGGALVPLGLAALGASARLVGTSVAFVAGTYVLIAAAPPGRAPSWLSLETFAFGITGAAVLSLLVAAAYVARRRGLLLVTWLGVEIVGYFALAPWPAARRVLAITVVGAMLLAWLFVQAGRDRRLVIAAMTLSVALGLLYQAADIDEAYAMRSAIRDAHAYVESRDEKLKSRFVARHAAQFELEKLGVRKYPNWHGLQPPYWYLISDNLHESGQWHGEVPSELLRIVEVRQRLPWTVQPAYSGMKVPLRGGGPSAVIAVFRQGSGERGR